MGGLGGKEQSRSLALKVKKEVSDEDSSSSDSEDEECGDPNHFNENVSKRQRTPIKEHSLEEYGATMEKMRWKRLKMKLAL
ncbi:hypothetical protein Tco_0571460 [Tanacetum coccineum]